MPDPSPALLRSLEALREQGVPFARIADLQRWEDNPKVHDENVVQLIESMRTFGWTNPVLVRAEDLFVEAGHGRLLAATHFGLEEVPVVRLEHSERDARLYALADNRLNELSPWDPKLLPQVMAEFSPRELGLAGWTADQLPDLTFAPDPLGEPEEDEVPEVPAEPITRLGDIWRLGDHLLLCGDSTDWSHANHVIAAGAADLVFTDPPYGVNYVGGTKRKLKIQNDGAEGLGALLDGAFAVALKASRAGATWYVCAPAGPQGLETGNRLQALGIFRQRLVWVKDALVLGHSDYHYRHEDIYYGWKQGANRRGTPDRSQDTVWEFPRPKRSELHPTMKPVALVEHALRNSSKPGELVFEPFGGSGSTLIACHRNARRCVAIELDPGYCDVIVQRWEKETGETALRGTDGKVPRRRSVAPPAPMAEAAEG